MPHGASPSPSPVRRARRGAPRAVRRRGRARRGRPADRLQGRQEPLAQDRGPVARRRCGRSGRPRRTRSGRSNCATARSRRSSSRPPPSARPSSPRARSARASCAPARPGSAQIADGAVTGAKVADGSLDARDTARFSGRFRVTVPAVGARDCWSGEPVGLAAEQAGADISGDLVLATPDSSWPERDPRLHGPRLREQVALRARGLQRHLGRQHRGRGRLPLRRDRPPLEALRRSSRPCRRRPTRRRR